MARIHRSVITVAIMTAALGGTALGTGGIARAGSADDPTTFEKNAAVPKQDDTIGNLYFHVVWTADVGRPGMTRLTGYVYNDYGEAAKDVELQVTGVDAAGRPVSRMIQPITDTVPARGRSYFDLQVPSSPSYQLNVMSFDFMEPQGGK